MKNLLILGILVFTACLGSSCQDVTIGFLQTEDAGYNPDTMVVKKELDTTPPQLEEVDNPLYYELLAENPEYYTPGTLDQLGHFTHSNYRSRCRRRLSTGSMGYAMGK